MNLIPSPSLPTFPVDKSESSVNVTKTGRPVKEDPDPVINDGFVVNTFFEYPRVPMSSLDNVVAESVTPMDSLIITFSPSTSLSSVVETVNEIDSDKKIPSRTKLVGSF